MRVDNRINKYNPRNRNRRAVEKKLQRLKLTDHKTKGAYALLKKRFKVALGCMVIRSQAELMIHRVQVLYSSSEPVTDGGRVITEVIHLAQE